jgi:4-hydroxythreonine-4-phosphate dehydrogenase
MKINAISDIRDAVFQRGVLDVFDLRNKSLDSIAPGHISGLCGKAAFEAIKTAIELALNNEIQANVTGPIHKKSLHEANYPYSGHTEIYADLTKTEKYAMLLAEKNLRIVHVSTHVSLRKACDLVKKQRILDVIKLLDEHLAKLGLHERKIAVAGLNPHAGDFGLFGDEEQKEITPAIEEAKNRGFNVEGPVPPDTLFPKAIAGYYEGCVVMYHDQGHIPFKVAGFNWDNRTNKMEDVKGINVTLGLPIIRTSVDHGTAFDIAGKGFASENGMIEAINYAAKLVNN